MNGEWVYWLGWLAALAAYVAMVYIAWRALFRDRAKGRRRCPRCWYDLAYSPGMTCPECGLTAQNERQFRRTRRHYGRACIAIGVCVAIVMLGNQLITQASWYSILPTRVLIAALPLADQDNSGLFREIGVRLRSDQLSRSERHALVRRLVSGSWGARPLSDAWRQKYGEVIDTLRPGLARGRGDDGEYSELESMLLDLPADVHLASREVWPLDASPTVQLRLQDWWPLSTDCRVRIAPRLENADPVVAYRSSRLRAWSDYPLVLPMLEESVREVTFDAVVERRRADGDQEWVEANSMVITVPLRRAGLLAEVIEPVDDEALTDAVRATFRNGAVLWSAGPAPLRVFFSPDRTHHPQFNDIAVGAHVDILRDDQLVRRLDIWWLGGDATSDRGVAFNATEFDADLVGEANQDDGRWTMRVTGDPSLALRPGNATKYWRGSFTVPLQVTFSENRAPQPRWWTTTEAVDSDEEAAESEG